MHYAESLVGCPGRMPLVADSIPPGIPKPLFNNFYWRAQGRMGVDWSPRCRRHQGEACPPLCPRATVCLLVVTKKTLRCQHTLGCRPERGAKYLHSEGKPAWELVKRGDRDKVTGGQGSAERGGCLLSQGLHTRWEERKGLLVKLWSVKCQWPNKAPQQYAHSLFPLVSASHAHTAPPPDFRCPAPPRRTRRR